MYGNRPAIEAMLTMQPGFLRDHVTRRGLAHQERAAQPDVHRRVPRLLGQFLELAGNDLHGVIDEDVDPAELAHDRIDEPVDVGLTRDVGRQRAGFARRAWRLRPRSRRRSRDRCR